jgi:hypothetical protein
MSTQAAETSIRTSIVVDAPIERAFTDLSRTSEVEVRFAAESSDRTRVELEHRNLDRHGDGWEPERDAVGSEGGWPLYLQRFAERVAA